MLLGLGIDTGGTFTDGVIYDFDEGKVIQRAKRQTTPFRLSDGIEALMEALTKPNSNSSSWWPCPPPWPPMPAWKTGAAG